VAVNRGRDKEVLARSLGAHMNEVFPLEQTQAAYDRMMSGKARFRVVLKIEL
jgi:D-arabinose 1-dehydrogenase-like Zn-dependent alcohol dehydrogenase